MDPQRTYAGLSLYVDAEGDNPCQEFYTDQPNLSSKTRSWVRDMVGIGVPFVQWPDFNTVVELLKASPPHTYIAVRCYSLLHGAFDHDDAHWPRDVPHGLGGNCICWQHGKVRCRKHCASIGAGRRSCFSDRCAVGRDPRASHTIPASPAPPPITEAQVLADLPLWCESFYGQTHGHFPGTSIPLDLAQYTGSFSSVSTPVTSRRRLRAETDIAGSPPPTACSVPPGT